MNDRKLRVFAPIFSDPVGWSRWIGNSLFFVLFWFILHSLFVMLGLWGIYEGLILSGFEHQRAIDIVKTAFLPIGVAGIFFPTMYAYAIYRLLKIIDESNP